MACRESYAIPCIRYRMIIFAMLAAKESRGGEARNAAAGLSDQPPRWLAGSSKIIGEIVPPVPVLRSEPTKTFLESKMSAWPF